MLRRSLVQSFATVRIIDPFCGPGWLYFAVWVTQIYLYHAYMVCAPHLQEPSRSQRMLVSIERPRGELHQIADPLVRQRTRVDALRRCPCPEQLFEALNRQQNIAIAQGIQSTIGSSFPGALWRARILRRPVRQNFPLHFAGARTSISLVRSIRHVHRSRPLSHIHAAARISAPDSITLLFAWPWCPVSRLSPIVLFCLRGRTCDDGRPGWLR